MKLFVKNTNGVQSMSYQRYWYCLYVFSLMFCITIYQLCTYTKMLNYAWKLCYSWFLLLLILIALTGKTYSKLLIKELEHFSEISSVKDRHCWRHFQETLIVLVFFKSSHSQLLWIIDVLKTIWKIQKQPQKLFLKIPQNSQVFSWCFWHRCFPVNFVTFLRILYLQNTSGRLLMKIWNNFWRSLFSMKLLSSATNFEE